MKKPKLRVLPGGLESLYKQAAQAFVDGDETLLAEIRAEIERIARRQAELEVAPRRPEEPDQAEG